MATRLIRIKATQILLDYYFRTMYNKFVIDQAVRTIVIGNCMKAIRKQRVLSPRHGGGE